MFELLFVRVSGRGPRDAPIFYSTMVLRVRSRGLLGQAHKGEHGGRRPYDSLEANHSPSRWRLCPPAYSYVTVVTLQASLGQTKPIYGLSLSLLLRSVGYREGGGGSSLPLGDTSQTYL
jgi:hypothetical protein